MHNFSGDKNFFNFNSDMSGDVEIGWRHELFERGQVEFYDREKRTVRVSADDLLAFLAEIVRRRKISALEDATTEQLLFGEKGASDGE